MSWEQEVKEIERRRYLAQQQGGKDGENRQQETIFEVDAEMAHLPGGLVVDKSR